MRIVIAPAYGGGYIGRSESAPPVPGGLRDGVQLAIASQPVFRMAATLLNRR
ncbi:MAG TPA: hypothetical protein VK827_12440 [Lysobacter sp.]|nr:hypothetical protein [Lysobacter sp.]